MGERLKYTAVKAKQSARHKVLTFAARAQDVLRFAVIDRVGRSKEGTLSGFQRPQIASHINEIRDYLAQDDAVLPNPIVVAFVEGVEVKEIDDYVSEITIDLTSGPPGSIVDGQQRITAIAGLAEKNFEIFVSALVCNDYDELRRQFVLINNTRPLPKALIYELLPTVQGLPLRLQSRTLASSLTARLNYDDASSLKSQIFQHTNPVGIIRDTSIQRVIMNSVSDGALREFGVSEEGVERGFSMISNFYKAVQETFPEDWENQTPRTSRLVHGAGVVALGYVMEALHARDGSFDVKSFKAGLVPLVGVTSWRDGYWEFGPNDRRAWDSIQNISRDIMQLAHHLVGIVKRRSMKVQAKRAVAAG
jgi:DGQHR domain-containing protein